jgi:iron(III) transport system permease protein
VSTSVLDAASIEAGWPGGQRRLELRARRLVAVGAPLLVGAIVTLPLLLLLLNSFNLAQPGRDAAYGVSNWIAAFSDPSAVSALWNTVALGAVRTALSLPIALTLTWLVARSDMPGRWLVELLCWLGVFLPLLPLTLGWILLMDPGFGLVNDAIEQTGLVQGPVFNIYSFWGIVWVHIASSTVYYRSFCCCPSSDAPAPS